MEKCENIDQLREVLRNIILAQDLEEIKNFNTLYDYSSITDMTYLWGAIRENILKSKFQLINWKNTKFPILDLKNVKFRERIFKNCPLYEINLINTYNIKYFENGFSGTKNLKKIKLDLNKCEDRSSILEFSGIEEVELLNTGNIKKINGGFERTKNLKKISLDLSGCKERSFILKESGVKEVELLNTQNIIWLKDAFTLTKNLEKINDLYLDNCVELTNAFRWTNLKEVNLYNTGKVENWDGCFSESKIEEIELDMGSCKNREYMFYQSQIKKINLKNCEKIKKMRGFIRGRKNCENFEINLTNVEDMTNFINENNNLKYLKISGTKEYLKEKNIKMKNIKIDFCDIFFEERHLDEKIKKHYKKNPIPYIELGKKNTSFNIIADEKSDVKIKKYLEKTELGKKNINKILEKKEKTSLEINL